MKKLLIYGINQFAEMMKYYIEQQNKYEIEAFVMEQKYITEKYFCGLPIVAFEDVSIIYPSNNYEIFLAIGYREMNQIRSKKFYEFKELGYTISSYISEKAIINTNSLGEGNIILENVIIGPFTQIGTGNIIWSGVNIAHHNIVGNFNFIALSSSVAGNVIIKDNCFIGNNATIKNGVTINDLTLIGAGCYISKDTECEDVYVPERVVKLNKISREVII